MIEPARFDIAGSSYEVPALITFTMDEAQILYERAGVLVEDFFVGDVTFTERLRNPGVIRALVEVAWLRGNPDADRARAAEVSAAANYASAVSDLLAGSSSDGGEDDDAVPPTGRMSENGDGSSSSDATKTQNGDETAKQPENSGSSSKSGSVERDAIPAATGTTESGTSSIAAEMLSAA